MSKYTIEFEDDDENGCVIVRMNTPQTRRSTTFSSLTTRAGKLCHITYRLMQGAIDTKKRELDISPATQEKES